MFMHNSIILLSVLWLQMYKDLDKHVIGQHRAKMVLSVAMYNHYKRLNFTLSTNRLTTEEETKDSEAVLSPGVGTSKQGII